MRPFREEICSDEFGKYGYFLMIDDGNKLFFYNITYIDDEGKHHVDYLIPTERYKECKQAVIDFANENCDYEHGGLFFNPPVRRMNGRTFGYSQGAGHERSASAGVAHGSEGN